MVCADSADFDSRSSEKYRMKILVTGGCGFIGTNLVRHLLAHTTHDILNVDKLTYAGNPQSLADVTGSPRYHFARVDLADPIATRKVVAAAEPDAVIHLAAESHVDRSIDAPSEFVQTNVVGTFNLVGSSLEHWKTLSGRRRQEFRFLHVSTDEVYGTLGDTGRFTESTRYDPHSPYAASKAASDHLVRSWGATYDLPVIVTNCSNNFGPYQFPEKLIPLMIIKCLNGEPLPVYGTGVNVRDWLFVGDHVNALATVLDKGVAGQTYNIGGDSEYKNIDLVKLICEILDELKAREDGAAHADAITFVADRPGHDLRYAIDSSKIQSELAWKPQRGFEENLRRTVQWYLDHRKWWLDILDGNYNLRRLGGQST